MAEVPSTPLDKRDLERAQRVATAFDACPRNVRLGLMREAPDLYFALCRLVEHPKARRQVDDELRRRRTAKSGPSGPSANFAHPPESAPYMPSTENSP